MTQSSVEPTSGDGGFWRELRLAYSVLRDRQTPIYLKALPAIGLLYFLFPFEGLAFWPLGTPVDDIALLYVALKGLLYLAPADVVSRHRRALGMDVVDAPYEVIEKAPPADFDLDEQIVLNPDRKRSG